MIKRYAQNSYYMLTEGEYGQWCKYEDIQKLEQENKELVELVHHIIREVRNEQQSGFSDSGINYVIGTSKEKLEAIKGEE